ncbi:MAG: phosphoheptose isomerase [Gammaproteobacteria bacterium]|nr:phosphoheptose isomerase [Gammaproteobacteria bacterium]MCW5582712.1 phosphoheptose isomerase [Gammaproteobacteria bacterium]
MNSIIDRIRINFTDSIQTKINSADSIINIIAEASEEIVQALLEGHKILSCGNGASACDALHFSSQMLNRFKQERPGLPAIALNSDISTMTAIANDYHFSDVFAKQVRAIGQAGDLLLAISTSGNSANIVNAIKAAHDKNMGIIALTGYDGGKIVDHLQEKDIEIRVPAYDPPRIQEMHILIIHCICDIVDFRLFGHGEVIT